MGNSKSWDCSGIERAAIEVREFWGTLPPKRRPVRTFASQEQRQANRCNRTRRKEHEKPYQKAGHVSKGCADSGPGAGGGVFRDLSHHHPPGGLRLQGEPPHPQPGGGQPGLRRHRKRGASPVHRLSRQGRDLPVWGDLLRPLHRHGGPRRPAGGRGFRLGPGRRRPHRHRPPGRGGCGLPRRGGAAGRQLLALPPGRPCGDRGRHHHRPGGRDPGRRTASP